MIKLLSQCFNSILRIYSQIFWVFKLAPILVLFLMNIFYLISFLNFLLSSCICLHFIAFLNMVSLLMLLLKKNLLLIKILLLKIDISICWGSYIKYKFLYFLKFINICKESFIRLFKDKLVFICCRKGLLNRLESKVYSR